MRPVHRKPTFSYLKRKRTISGDDDDNDAKSTKSSPPPRPSSPPPPPQRPPPPTVAKPKRHASSGKLQQLRLDLGPPSRKTCKVCGMDYVSANPEDSLLHKKYHDSLVSATVDGVDLGRAFAQVNHVVRWGPEARRFREACVVVVDRKSAASSRSQARKALDVVNKQLSAPTIEDEVLWSLSSRRLATATDSEKKDAPAGDDETQGGETSTERYKVFLHMKDSRCVGLCLAERIWEANPVIGSLPSSKGRDNNATSSSVTVAETPRPAIVGISRIWTATAMRQKGVAMDLLDNVRTRFIYGTDIPKDRIAFSQPTESGCRLMRTFYGFNVGEKETESDTKPLKWLVYRER